MEQSSKYCDVVEKIKWFVCMSLELQQIESVLKYDANDLHVMASCRHILIVHGLISSFCTPLVQAIYVHTTILLVVLSHEEGPNLNRVFTSHNEQCYFFYL